tara:strand:- start:775 stop:2208 length:1434 start_codon:yes stop_codon:yes gene_type:complete
VAKRKVIKSIWDFIDEQIDPRYDETKIGQKAIKDMRVRSDVTGSSIGPEVSIFDYEGHPAIFTQSDRLDAARGITGINDINFKEKVDVPGGQGYMLNNLDKVWASEEGPAQQIIDLSNYLYRETGKQPILLPWRMAPTGGDHAHATGQTLLAYAQTALGKSDKKKFDSFMKSMRSTKKQGNQLLFPDWPGLDSTKLMDYYNNSTSKARKRMIELMGGAVGRNKPLEGMDVLRAGQARAAVSDPSQLNAVEGGLQNLGLITTNRNLVGNTGNTTYGSGVLGQGVGTLKPNQRNITVFDMEPPAMLITDANNNPIKGLGKQEVRTLADYKGTGSPYRPFQMKPYGTILDDKKLKKLSKKGFYSGAAAPTAGLLSTESPQQKASNQDALSVSMDGIDTKSRSLPEFGGQTFETALAMLRGMGVGLLDAIQMIADGMVPESAMLPSGNKRITVPDFQPKYMNKKEKDVVEQIGLFSGPTLF